MTIVPRTGPFSASCALATTSWYQRGKSSACGVSTRAIGRHYARSTATSCPASLGHRGMPYRDREVDLTARPQCRNCTAYRTAPGGGGALCGDLVTAVFFAKVAGFSLNRAGRAPRATLPPHKHL